MFQRFKRWREKRAHKKTIQYAMQMLRSVYPNVGVTTRAILVQTVWDLVADYNEAYGSEDGVADFYFDRINYVVNIMDRRDISA